MALQFRKISYFDALGTEYICRPVYLGKKCCLQMTKSVYSIRRKPYLNLEPEMPPVSEDLSFKMMTGL